MKNQKGITLIALVVTIIVLLILAGISIAMLTGENGIIRNAQEAATYNAYAGAEEQVKLAYMAVRTQMMVNTVADGTYDGRLAANILELAKVVSRDLNDKTKWKVSYKAGSSSADAYIYIKYTDTKIDKGIIDGTTGSEVPAEEGQVNYVITVKDQTASLTVDTGAEVTDGTAVNSL